MLGLLNYIIWDVSPFIFEGEHFAIEWYGTLWVIGLLLWIASQWVIYKHESIPSEYVWYKFLYMCLGVLIGARIGHCWFYEWHFSENPIHFLGVEFWYRNVYIEKPWLMFDLSHGVHGLSSHGGACGLLISALLLDRRFKTGIIWMFDRAVFGVCLCGACIRLGNLFNSEIYGFHTTMPWGFVFVNNGDTLPSHPTQIYEMLYCLVTFAVLTYLYCKRDAGKYRGLLFGVFMICIFATRIGLEFIKNDQEQFESNLWLNMGQLLSIPFVLWGVYLVVKALKNGKQPVVVPDGVRQTKPRSKSRYVSIIILSIAFVSCQPPSRMDNEYHGGIVIHKEIDDDFILEGTLDVTMRSRCVFYSYTSVNSAGIEDTLSAMLVMNRNNWRRKRFRGITLWNRPTITAERDCPSSMNLIAEPVLAKFSHTVVVSPDLQGFGCNNKPQAYCYAEINGRAAADALLAAEKLLDSIGVSYGESIYNIGYSQGAQTALAALPFFKNGKIQTFLGDGIYDLLEYYNQTIKNGDIQVPADIPLTLIAAIECAGAELDYLQCFARESQLQWVDDVLSKQYSFPEMNSIIGTCSLRSILSPQLCDTSSWEYHQLASALQKMSYIPYERIDGNRKIYIYHSTTDSIMPLSQSEYVSSIIRDSSPASVYHRYGDFGSHEEAILPFVRYALIRILL